MSRGAAFGAWVMIGMMAVVGCEGEEGAACVRGASAPCACPDGDSGAQVCQADGSFGLCVCEGDEAPANNDPNNDPNNNPNDVGDDPDDTPNNGPGEGVEGVELMSRLGGLWGGAATQTPLGTFPVMNMDLRAASDRVLFGRVDMDPANNLRFAFSIETHGGRDVLVYRNGGFFMGLLRDSRAALVEHDAEGSTWRFCDVNQGCGLIDALWTLSGEDRLELDVKVRGQQHLSWQARRLEERALPATFPVDERSAGGGDAPYPPMPRLEVEVTWDGATENDAAAAWVILSDTACGLTGSGCRPSRSIGVAVEVGAERVVVPVEQLHPGRYFLNAVLDVDGDFVETRFPRSGDGVALPDKAITVEVEGESRATARIVRRL